VHNALKRKFIEKKDNFQLFNSEYEKAVQENTKLKKDNYALQKDSQETIALYEITRQICSSLDEDKIFAIFKELISKYIQVGDCRFIKEESSLLNYKNYTVIPLNIDKHNIGYLAASAVYEGQREKFNILSQQFLLGIKRALLYKKVQELAITDSLTQVFSRRYFLERFNEELQRSKKFELKFCFLMADIDYFKSYNDQYGHLVGDAILREVARAIKENIRQIDFVGRYGGEELSIILAETDKEQAGFAAERIRGAVESKQINVYDEELKVTVSIGISTFPDDAKDIPAVIDTADRAMYKAKEAGRNRVCIYGKA
jgi:diguanylate cyclase (GGDEF)-like protein